MSRTHGVYCTYTWVFWQGTDAQNLVGELHTRYWAQDANFTYGTQADSTIEVGYSSNNGPYSANGTVNVSNSITQTGGIEQQNKNWGYQIKLPFHYEQDRQYTNCGGYLNNWQIYATQWNGGTGPLGNNVSGYDGYYYQPNASTFTPGAFYDRTSTAAVKYNVGATAFGVGLSSQSGYSRSVTLHWQARYDSGGYGCLYGSHGDYISTAGIIYAGPYGSSC